MCACECVHVCMCIYMYVCVHVCVCMCARVCACVCMCKVVTSKFHNHYNVLTINLEDLQVDPRFEIIRVLKTPPSGVHMALIGAGIHCWTTNCCEFENCHSWRYMLQVSPSMTE